MSMQILYAGFLQLADLRATGHVALGLRASLGLGAQTAGELVRQTMSLWNSAAMCQS